MNKHTKRYRDIDWRRWCAKLWVQIGHIDVYDADGNHIGTWFNQRLGRLDQALGCQWSRFIFE